LTASQPSGEIELRAEKPLQGSMSTAPTSPDKEVAALLAAIVESSDDAIISCSLDGSITSWNCSAERIFGYTADEMLGRSTSVLSSHAAEDDPTLVLHKIRCGHRIEHYETLRRHKDGSDIVVSLSVSPVCDGSGRIIGASKVARDITAMRCAKESLRNADRLALAGRLVASIAHEINNPLEAVTNLLFLLQQEHLSSEGRQYLDLAERELLRVSHIASQTLGFFRAMPGRAQVQLAEIVDSAISLHVGRMTVSGIKVDTDYKPVAPLLCYQGELRQVIVNLVSNALDSITSNGQLRIRIRAATDLVDGRKGIRLTIADNGSGMSARTLGQIFEPFYTTKESTGTGLGLWVTQQIVTRHKGKISLRSSQTPVQHGTVFSLFFPHTQQEGSDLALSMPEPRAEAVREKRFTSPEDESRHTPSQHDQSSTAYNAA
jgi:PAS domain S-box-containing protein